MGAFEYVGAGVGECVYGGREHSVNSKGNKREARNSVGQEKSKKSKCKGIALHLGADPKGAKNTRANKDNRGEEKYVLTETCKTDF